MQPEFHQDSLATVLGYGLLTTTGAEHKQMKKALNPAFSIQSLSAQIEIYYDPITAYVLSVRLDFILKLTSVSSTSCGRGRKKSPRGKSYTCTN